MKKKYSSPVFRYLDLLQVQDENVAEPVQKEDQTMARLSGTSLRAYRKARSLRLTADAGQILIGSVCLAFCFLAVFLLVWESR
jgi:hypothetical protein